MKPEIDWLQSKWALPPGAATAVAGLLTAHASGSTAYKLERAVSDWGNAAAEPKNDTTTPLVLVPHGGATYLQTRWFFGAEKKIAAHLARLHAAPPGTAPAGFLAKYFPEPGGQRDAAALALSHGLSIITGGPGTGKTYTLARILAILLETGATDPRRIQLAAPTGKAADRMREAVRDSSGGLAEGLRAKLVEASCSSKTIHSLLGYHPGKNAFSRHAGCRLPCHVVIVDECSMVDTLLWDALLDALPESAKLILLGDPNQLESVGRGNAFAEMAASPALAPARIHLTKSRRFADRPAIARLALAIEARNPGDALETLSQNQNPACPDGLFWNESASLTKILEALPPAVLDAMQAVAFAPAPADALQALGKVRILTSHRSPSVGHSPLGAMLEEILAKKNPGERILNRPVIIDRNDPETGLRNGEVGVIHSPAPETRLAFFEKREAGIPTSNLPDHSPAWSITIHRSQGSEYDNVVAILPRAAESPLATRELLYTAITRASANLSVFGPAEVVEKAVSKAERRTALLGFHLENAP